MTIRINLSRTTTFQGNVTSVGLVNYGVAALGTDLLEFAPQGSGGDARRRPGECGSPSWAEL